MNRPPLRPKELLIGGPCELTCAGLCDCRHEPSEPGRIAQVLSEGGSRLTLRGSPATHNRLGEYVKQARESGFGEVTVRTNALAFAADGAAESLARRGVDSVLVPFFSHVPTVHDRIAGRPGALVQTLVGIRKLAAAGLALEIEVPILSPRLQQLTALIDLVHRAAPALRAVRFYLPRHPVADQIAPPDWDEGAPLLAAALERCQELHLNVGLRGVDAIPLCALRKFPALQHLHKFDPRKTGQLAQGCSLPDSCRSCAAREQCPGVAPSYSTRHGSRGLHPYEHRPLELYEQRTTPGRKWDEAQRQAARQATLLVLRPTVNCNQDCTFCSANETSNNIWSDPEEMLRTIARAARRGVDRISFGGGEPTLSKDLPRFIRAAHRCGVRIIELVTNGVLLDNEKKVATLRDAGLTHAFISLHAHDERLSRVLTQKAGDHPRTVKAIQLLQQAGVVMQLNHVITARNYRFLPHFVEFAHREFEGKPIISFAFVTPQYKALENIDLVPRLSDVMPYFRRALRRALELKQPFVIGSRQGTPPCFLGEFRGWSDVLKITHEARSEDAHQKTQGEACRECRYQRHCTGLWRPYVARYGTGELQPIRGAPFTDVEIDGAMRNLHRNANRIGLPTSFEEVPELFRDRAAEQAALPQLEEPQLTERAFSLPTVDLRSRPLRLAMIGSGRQARRLARGFQAVRGMSLDAVASPHAPDGDLSEFGGCPSYRSAEEALADIRPEAAIIAAATHAHFELAKLAIAQQVPILLEKPITRTEEQATELIKLATASQALVMPAHNDLFASGVPELLGRGPFSRFSFLRRLRPTSDETPRVWSRSSFYEMLYHALILTGRALGGGVAEIRRAHTRGDSIPQFLRLELGYGQAEAEVVFDFTASVDEQSLVAQPVDPARPAITWRRSGRELTLTEGGSPVAFRHQGNEVENMLAAFRDAVLGKVAPATKLEEALEIMRSANAAIEAMAAAGTAFERPNAPKHVATRPELREAMP